MSPASAAAAVSRGAAFLDEHDPGWWQADTDRPVDLATLVMSRGDLCILGQRCPLEVLTARIPENAEPAFYKDHRYYAYAEALSGSGYSFDDAAGAAQLHAWSGRHGFNSSGGSSFSELTEEWKRVITARRENARGEDAHCTDPVCDHRPGSPFPGREGYLTGECGHAVAASEWRAGFRKCERC